MNNLTKLNLDEYKPLRDVAFENLREAIRKLELEGLVVMLPRKGAYVADMSLKDMIDVLEIRASLEGLAASLAAQRISDEDIKKLESIVDEFKDSVSDLDVESLL